MFCYKLFKRHNFKKAIILGIIGLLLFIISIYGIFNLYNLIKYDIVTKEFIEINQGFNFIHSSNKKSIAGINVEITGSINGKGKISIMRPPFEEKNGLLLDLENEINIKLNNIDWYNNEYFIEFIPENEFIYGIINIKIIMY